MLNDMKNAIDIGKLYDKTFDWLLRYGPRFVVGMLILFAGFWLIRVLLNWSQNKMHHKQVDPTIKPFFMSLLGVALRILLILGVMQIIGIQMTIFATIIGAFGVAVGLALSGTLQNFAS